MKTEEINANFDTERIIIKTSENSPEIAEKIDKISNMLIKRNKEAYERLSKMP